MTSPFSGYEQKALRLLISPILGPATIDVIVREALHVQTRFLDAGYDVEVMHPNLPGNDQKFDSPQVIGVYEGVEIRFTASIDDGALKFMARRLGSGDPVPEYMRQRDVQIATP